MVLLPSLGNMQTGECRCRIMSVLVMVTDVHALAVRTIPLSLTHNGGVSLCVRLITCHDNYLIRHFTWRQRHTVEVGTFQSEAGQIRLFGAEFSCTVTSVCNELSVGTIR